MRIIHHLNMEGESSNGEKVPRRSFIKGILGYSGYKAFERIGIDTSLHFVGNTGANDRTTVITLDIAERVAPTENPNFRPFVKILQEGIDKYNLGNAQKVFFSRSPEYRDVRYYTDAIEKLTNQVTPIGPKRILRTVFSTFPPEAAQAAFQSDKVADGYDKVFVPGSGFNARFRESHPELPFLDGKFANVSPETVALMERYGQKEIEDTALFVEDQVGRDQKPISSSGIFSYFLKISNGNIAQSIFDTSIFLKYMARTDRKTGKFDPSDKNDQWYLRNISDEYQGASYTSPPEGDTVKNLIGKPYHTWNLVALLHYIPPELVRAGGLYIQLANYKYQGANKTRADLQTLNDLREIENFLLTNSKREENKL